MPRYIAVRLASALFTLFVLSILVFLIVRLLPGDAVEVRLRVTARTPHTATVIREYYGLDKPVYVQYWRWLSNALQGDLGTSFRGATPVTGLILDRASVTAELTLLAMIVSISLGIPLGILSAVWQNSPVDYGIRVVSMFSLSVPEFWQGIMLILLLSIILGWIPPLTYAEIWEHPRNNLTMMIIPAISLGTVASANIVRMGRGAMLEVLGQDYIRTARAKGLGEGTVVYSHALRNALIPIITIAGLEIGYLMGGAVVIEVVFNLPGLGRLVVNAIQERDYPVIQGVVIFSATMFLMSTLLVDVLYSYVNPRIRYGR